MPSLDSAEQLATGMDRLTRAMRSLAHRWDRTETAMRRSDVMLLRWLCDNGESRPGDIAETMGLNASVISRQLAALQADGLVSRRQDPDDGRADLVRLSSAGADRLAEVRQVYVARVRRVIDDWDDDTTRRTAQQLLDLAARLAHDACGDAELAAAAPGGRE